MLSFCLDIDLWQLDAFGKFSIVVSERFVKGNALVFWGWKGGFEQFGWGKGLERMMVLNITAKLGFFQVIATYNDSRFVFCVMFGEFGSCDTKVGVFLWLLRDRLLIWIQVEIERIALSKRLMINFFLITNHLLLLINFLLFFFISIANRTIATFHIFLYLHFVVTFLILFHFLTANQPINCWLNFIFCWLLIS